MRVRKHEWHFLLEQLWVWATWAKVQRSEESSKCSHLSPDGRNAVPSPRALGSVSKVSRKEPILPKTCVTRVPPHRSPGPSCFMGVLHRRERQVQCCMDTCGRGHVSSRECPHGTDQLLTPPRLPRSPNTARAVPRPPTLLPLPILSFTAAVAPTRRPSGEAGGFLVVPAWAERAKGHLST